MVVMPPTPRRAPGGPATARYPALLTKSGRPGQIQCRAATSGGRQVRQPARAGRQLLSSGMGPHRPECREREDGARGPPLPSSSTSRVVPEADSGDSQARGRGWRVAAATVWVPPCPLSRPSKEMRGSSLELLLAWILGT
jgi:hypothetical protein